MTFVTLLLPLLIVSMSVSEIATAETCKGNEGSPYHKLKKEILCSYDSTIRPVRKISDAVHVNASFLIRYISMDEHENILNVHMLLEMTWKDEFISWDPKDYNGTQVMVVDSGTVWTPDLQVYNDRYYYGGRSDLYISHVHMYYTGLMYAVAQGEMAAHCNMDIYKWPFDRHNCTAYFGSQNYHGNYLMIDFGKQRVNMKLYLNSSVWQLENVLATRSMTNYTFQNTTVPYVRFNKFFIVKRFSSALFSTITIPIIACIFLTLSSLWIDPQDLTRMVCILIALVGHVSFLQFLGDSLPPNSDRGVLIISILRDSLIISFLTFIAANVNRHLQTLQTIPPHFITNIINKLNSGGSAKFLLLPEEEKAASSEDEVNLVKMSTKLKHEWVLITSFIDRILFFLFLFIYIILFLVYTLKG